MSVLYDTQVLIDNVERICSVPLTQVTFTKLDIAIMASNELRLTVVPQMMRVRQEYFVTSVDVTPDSNGVIPIPNDAVGAKIEYLIAFTNKTFIKIPRLDFGNVASPGAPYVGFNGNYNITSGSGGFYLKGNNIHLFPPNLLNTYNQTVKCFYFNRANVIAQPNAFGRIIAIDYNTNTVELDNVNANWSADSEVSIQQGTPNEFKILLNTTIASVDNPNVVLTGDLTDVNIGDYVCDSGYAAIPQIPPDVHPWLYQLVAVKCMEALGDTQAMQNAQAKADALKTDLVGLIADRVEGQPMKIVNTNRFFSRGLRGRFGRGF